MIIIHLIVGIIFIGLALALLYRIGWYANELYVKHVTEKDYSELSTYDQPYWFKYGGNKKSITRRYLQNPPTPVSLTVAGLIICILLGLIALIGSGITGCFVS